MFPVLYTRFDECDGAKCRTTSRPTSAVNFVLPHHKCQRVETFLNKTHQPLAPDMMLPNSTYRGRLFTQWKDVPDSNVKRFGKGSKLTEEEEEYFRKYRFNHRVTPHSKASTSNQSKTDWEQVDLELKRLMNSKTVFGSLSQYLGKQSETSDKSETAASTDTKSRLTRVLTFSSFGSTEDEDEDEDDDGSRSGVRRTGSKGKGQKAKVITITKDKAKGNGKGKQKTSGKKSGHKRNSTKNSQRRVANSSEPNPVEVQGGNLNELEPASAIMHYENIAKQNAEAWAWPAINLGNVVSGTKFPGEDPTDSKINFHPRKELIEAIFGQSQDFDPILSSWDGGNQNQDEKSNASSNQKPRHLSGQSSRHLATAILQSGDARRILESFGGFSEDFSINPDSPSAENKTVGAIEEMAIRLGYVLSPERGGDLGNLGNLAKNEDSPSRATSRLSQQSTSEHSEQANLGISGFSGIRFSKMSSSVTQTTSPATLTDLETSEDARQSAPNFHHLKSYKNELLNATDGWTLYDNQREWSEGGEHGVQGVHSLRGVRGVRGVRGERSDHNVLYDGNKDIVSTLHREKHRERNKHYGATNGEKSRKAGVVSPSSEGGGSACSSIGHTLNNGDSPNVSLMTRKVNDRPYKTPSITERLLRYYKNAGLRREKIRTTEITNKLSSRFLSPITGIISRRNTAETNNNDVIKIVVAT